MQVPGGFNGPLGNPDQKDFSDILKKGEKIVGIVSIGDYAIGPLSVKNLIAKLFAAGCNIVVCACTIKPGTVSAVMAYPYHTFRDKSPALTDSLQRIENCRDAQILFSLI